MLHRVFTRIALTAASPRQDVLARRQWDRYHSGEETRDVLEVRVRVDNMQCRQRMRERS